VEDLDEMLARENQGLASNSLILSPAMHFVTNVGVHWPRILYSKRASSSRFDRDEPD
jgi:hypothetical protein